MKTHNGPTPGSSSHLASKSNTDHMVRVFGYCRVSTDMQAQHGLSLDAQQEMIKRFAAERGWTVDQIWVDGGYSAKNTDRPAFRQMAKAIKQSEGRIGAVVVSKLDRLTRSLKDLLHINEDILAPSGCNLVAVLDGINTFEPTSKMLLPLLAIVGQIERANTAERVKSTIAHIRSAGGHYGKIPFGYITVEDGRLRKLVPDPETYPWLQKIHAWYREGVPQAEIVRRLNAAHIPTKYGKDRTWTRSKLYELLRTQGVHKVRPLQSDHVHNRAEAYRIAYAMRTDDRTYPQIAEALNRAGLRPKNAAFYTAGSVLTLLRSAVFHDRTTPRGMALFLKEQGCSLREIGVKLAESGFHPPRGGQWYAQTVKLLLTVGDHAAGFSIRKAS